MNMGWLRILRSLLVGLSGCLVVAGTAQAAQPDRQAKVHQNSYQFACASCHGLDGRGMPQKQVGFDVPLPDFTECGFATREPDGDWATITAQGGPIRGFDRLMPSFAEALTEEQIDDALRTIRGFCEEDCWPRGELNFPRALVTEKAYVEDEFVFSTAVGTRKRTEVKNKLIYEKRFFSASQLEVIVPFVVAEGAGDEIDIALSDVALGVKTILVSSLATGTILSLAAEMVLPTGDSDEGYGKGVSVFEPFLAFGQALPADAFVQAQVGAEVPTDQTKADNEMFWRAAFGMTFEQSDFGRAWTPMVEVAGVHEFGDEAETLWDVVPGLQVTLNQRQHIMLGLGVQIPINETADRKPVVLAYLLWDWFDGGFGEGW